MFKLTSKPLEQFILNNDLSSKKCGAVVTFEGRVRNVNENRKVKALEYQADEKLCQREAEKIFKEAHKQFDVISVKCFHRVGKLGIGASAVWVAVTASHREDAFKACRYIIDELKKRLPIWKKEYYTDGTSEWINCKNDPSLQ